MPTIRQGVQLRLQAVAVAANFGRLGLNQCLAMLTTVHGYLMEIVAAAGEELAEEYYLIDYLDRLGPKAKRQLGVQGIFFPRRGSLDSDIGIALTEDGSWLYLRATERRVTVRRLSAKKLLFEVMKTAPGSKGHSATGAASLVRLRKDGARLSAFLGFFHRLWDGADRAIRQERQKLDKLHGYVQGISEIGRLMDPISYPKSLQLSKYALYEVKDGTFGRRISPFFLDGETAACVLQPMVVEGKREIREEAVSIHAVTSLLHLIRDITSQSKRWRGDMQVPANARPPFSPREVKLLSDLFERATAMPKQLLESGSQFFS